MWLKFKQKIFLHLDLNQANKIYTIIDKRSHSGISVYNRKMFVLRCRVSYAWYVTWCQNVDLQLVFILSSSLSIDCSFCSELYQTSLYLPVTTHLIHLFIYMSVSTAMSDLHIFFFTQVLFLLNKILYFYNVTPQKLVPSAPRSQHQVLPTGYLSIWNTTTL